MMGTAKQVAGAMGAAGVDAKRVFLLARPERFSQGCAIRPTLRLRTTAAAGRGSIQLGPAALGCAQPSVTGIASACLC
jgi:hypothetical protein